MLRALRAGDEQFRLLVDAVTEYAIFMLDRSGRVVSWNRGAERIKGYCAEEILGRHFSVFYAAEDVETGAPGEGLEKAAQEGQWTGEGWRVRKDGTRFWAHVTVTALYDEEDTLRGFAKVTRDLTEWRDREAELEREKQQAEEARQRAEAEKQRAEQRNALLNLMQAVATTANDAASLAEAMRKTIRAVCEYTGWPVGHVYRISHDGEAQVVPTGIWSCADAEQFERFRTVTEAATFALGQSLPGKVAERGAPLWIHDVAEDPGFVRRSRLRDEPAVRGAFGVPVRYDEKTVAVLEFFSEEPEEPDEKLLEALESVGLQLSRVAERERAQDELQRSEKRYRRLFEEAQEGISLTTPEGTIVDVNPAAERIFGYTREKLLDMNAAALYADQKKREQVAALLEQRGVLRNVELRGRRKDGEEVVLEASLTPRRGPDGKVEVQQTFFRDVTERKQAEEALRESEEKFRVLTEKTSVGVALLQDGVYQYVNPALARIGGYQPEEIIGRSPAMLFHPDDWPAVRDRLQIRLDGRVREMRYQARLLTKEGRVRRVEVFGSRLVYRGEPAIIGTVTDVTERRRLQREVLRIQEAERRRLGQDLHDGVASQLTGIAMLLGTLARRLQEVEEGEELAKQTEEIQELVLESGQDIRRLSRGLAPAGLSGKELPAALERLADNVAGSHFERQVKDLSKLSDDTAAHLYWIAQEAVANAQRYAEARAIAIRLQRRDGALVLEVEDDGRGFDVEEVDRGLGLRTMRYRAELLGASFSIDTAPGEGTRVRCRLAVEG